MRIVHFLVCVVFFISFLLIGVVQTALGQKFNEFSKEDSNAMLALKKQAELLFQQKNYTQSISQAQKALQFANKSSQELVKAPILLLLSNNYRQQQRLEDALRYALQAEQIARQNNATSLFAEIDELIAQIFYDQKNYNRAEYYFDQAADQRRKENKEEKTPALLFQKAAIYTQKKDVEKARTIYEELLKIYTEHSAPQMRMTVIKHLADMYVQNNRLKDALPYYGLLSSYYEEQNKIGLLIETYNNLGFLYKRNQQIQESLAQFGKAIELYQKYQDKLGETEKALVLENASVAYTQLKQFKKADNLLGDALKIYQKQNQSRNLANASNFIAANYYLNGDNLKALETVEKAITYGMAANQAEDVVAASYELMAKIYNADNNSVKKLEAETQAKLFKERFAERQKQTSEQLSREQEKLEKWEDKIRQELIEIGRRDVELAKQKQEKELQETQLKLEMQKNELAKQELAVLAEQAKTLKEQEKAQEALLLNEKLRREQIEQQLEAERQSQRIKNLEQDRRAKQFEILQNKTKQREAQRTLKEQEQQIEQEHRQRNIGIVFIILVSILFVVAGIGFVYARRSNKALRDRNVLIKKQSDEILLRNRTMELQKKQIESQNEALGVQNTKIQQSIRAAFTIQKALLPKDERLKTFFKEYFVVYRPKDVVSGDFYWVEKFGNKTFLVAADCTGHGVPGAFMSMIGNMLLDKIIEIRQIYDPALILQNLDQDVRTVLQQEENFDESGMDVCLCRIEPIEQGFEVVFSSAKRPLFFYDYSHQEIIENKGDRKSIGIKLKNSPDFTYSNQTLTLHANDCLYLSSDGYMDQANVNREKFGRKTFIKIIQDYHDATMNTQGEIFEKALAVHQGNAEQIDDILLMGVRL